MAPASSYRIAAYLESAGRLDVDLTVVSEGRFALVPGEMQGIRVDLSAGEVAVAAVLDAIAGSHVDAVVASDDATVELACRLSESLGLNHNPVSAARLARRKDLARGVQRNAGLNVPAFRVLDINAPLAGALVGVRYPCVVKPVAMAASRGVIRADDEATLLGAIERVRPIVALADVPEERSLLLVEDFVPGQEMVVEGMLRRGVLDVLALFDKPDPLDGPFFEETYYVTPSRLTRAEQQLAVATVATACDAYGLREGPIHAELRLNAAGAWLLEVAARTIGGECARLLRFGAGIGVEDLVLAHALDRSLEVVPDQWAAGVLMLPIERAGVLRRVEGVLDACSEPGIEEVCIAVREGYRLVPLPEGGSYLGFVFARAATADAVEAALRRAHSHLRVVVAPEIPVEGVVKLAG